MVKAGKSKAANKIKDLKAKKLGVGHAKAVRGGGRKHIAGVKYEDITVNCGTGMSKIVS